MTHFSKQNPITRQSLDTHINQRWTQLYQLEKESAERVLKYLLLTNSGGAIATLSFLGAAPAAIGVLGAQIALCFFLTGVVFVGIITAKTFHHMSNLFKRWKTDVANYHADAITWTHLQAEDKKRAVSDWWDYVISYGSFCCFMSGCIAGAWGLLARAGS